MRYQRLIFAVLIFWGCTHSENQIENHQKKRVYQAPKILTPPVIDGLLSDNCWKAAKWSAFFVDIEGDKKPSPFLETRVKMLWDTSHLYIGAELEETDIWGYITEKNVPIYKYCNDFEMFIDPDRDNHNYYELELNVLNTIWELTLVKPYRNGGPAIDPTNLLGLRTAVAYQGSVNEPTDVDSCWTVEIAIPFEDLHNYRKEHTRVLQKPKPIPGDVWGVNFSRVHWDHEIIDNTYRQIPDRPAYNWVWAPQGIMSMHEPEKWGLLFFSDSQSYEPDWNEEAVRDLLMELYHAQLIFKKENGYFVNSIEEMNLTHPLPDYIENLEIQVNDQQFVIKVVYHDDTESKQMLYIDESSYLSAK